MPYEDKIMVASGDSEHPGIEEVSFETIPSHGGDFNPDILPLSTNISADADLFITKENNTWYKKAINKVWDYIKSKIQASSNEVAYGTCTTAADVFAKEVTLVDAGNWVLKKGAEVTVKFTYSNSANNPTLNVNGTGAKSIYAGNNVVTGTGYAGTANRYTKYMYDGTYWCWIGQGVDNNTTYSAMSTSELLTGTANSQRTMRADYTKAGIEALSTGYGTCDTAADVAAKVVTMNNSNWKLRVGAMIGVKFTNTNTASNCTLNVNNTGAKSIWYNNAVYTAAGTWQAGTANRYIYYMYDGTYWVWMGHSIDADGNNATRQYPTNTTNADYRVLLSYGANDNDETNLTRKDTNFKYNPNTNNLSVAKINGVPPINTFVGTRAEWEALSAAEKAKYLTMDFIDEGGFGDISDNEVSYTSSDVADGSATAWTNVTPITSGLSLRTLFSRVSQMFKNIRYLYKTFIDETTISTTEKYIGTYNGNSLYRKLIELSYAASSGTSHTQLLSDYGITGSNVKRMYGYAEGDSNYGSFLPFPCYYNSNAYIQTYINKGTNTLYINNGPQYNNNPLKIHLIVEYTK